MCKSVYHFLKPASASSWRVYYCNILLQSASSQPHWQPEMWWCVEELTYHLMDLNLDTVYPPLWVDPVMTDDVLKMLLVVSLGPQDLLHISFPNRLCYLIKFRHLHFSSTNPSFLYNQTFLASGIISRDISQPIVFFWNYIFKKGSNKEEKWLQRNVSWQKR